MSRLFVKNLPGYVAESRLKDFFSQKGEVTDVKLLRTDCGKSRRIAFIGFHTEGEAQAALKYFHNSYLDTSKISCEVAIPNGDSNIPKPWSCHLKKKQEELNRERKNSSAKCLAPLRPKEELKKFKKSLDLSDPKLQEFMHLMQPRSKSKLWANDTVGILLDQKAETCLKKSQSQQGGEIKANNWAKPLIRCKASLPHSKSPQDRQLDELDEQEKDFSLTHSTERSHNLNQDELLCDMDYFKSRVKKDWSDSGSENSDNAPNESPIGEDACEVTVEKFMAESTSKPSQAQAESGYPFQNLDSGVKDLEYSSHLPKNENKLVLESGRLFVRNLHYSATEDDLTELFQGFGSLSEIHLVLDSNTKMSKGYAFVLYAQPESAVRALGELDKKHFQGRILHIMPSEHRPNASEKKMTTAASQSSKSFKDQKVENRKAAEASGNTRAWNSFFMHPDTIVENMARKYGVRKSDILDPEANNVAVRVALGETQVILDTKKALVKSGVNVAALEKLSSGRADAINRSNHVILVKNLPYGTSEGDLVTMFGRYGDIDKVILPPAKTLALVVFLEAAACKAAFKGLSYRRYKDAPLYLEKPPSDILSPTSKLENDSKDDDVERVKLEQQQHNEALSDEDVDLDIVQSRTLFVNNLNFKTSDECLRNHFSVNIKEGSIRSAEVKKKKAGGKILSKGYGFIEFDSEKTARNVGEMLQGTVLDGHALKLEICHSKNVQGVKSAEKVKSTTKLILKNLAFEATKDELKEIFSTFGQIKRLRLPRKPDGNHRGFAFVEFFTEQEARNALVSLSSTHLHRRHMILDVAKEDESVEELRAQTGARYVDEKNGFQTQMQLSKKRKRI